MLLIIQLLLLLLLLLSSIRLLFLTRHVIIRLTEAVMSSCLLYVYEAVTAAVIVAISNSKMNPIQLPLSCTSLTLAERNTNFPKPP